jgi:hypothetical protein
MMSDVLYGNFGWDWEPEGRHDSTTAAVNLGLEKRVIEG